MLPLALPPAFADVVPPPAAAARPHLAAARVETPPVIDGDLDDDVWKQVPATTAFLEKVPRAGAMPADKTTLRIAYDDDALYVAFDCEQKHAPIVRRLTRRDRLVEGDWVSIAIDTRRDGRRAFDFNVNAAGVLVDALHYNDTDFTFDWDENWEARARTRPFGWSVEMRIPLRVLRFTSADVQSWGFQARRYVSDRQELDEWAYTPRTVAGEVSHYGRLDGLRNLRATSSVELRPFVLGRYRHRDVQASQVAAGSDFGGSAGLDLKWHATQDLTLDATFNPDFAQVEADQIVLNLTTYETYYPEKRPFFLEGIDTFTTPFQLLYTRRIGRAVPPPALRTGEKLVDVPSPATIYAASKLIGRLGGWDVGTLSAVTAENDVEIEPPGGGREVRVADPRSTFNAVRVRHTIAERATVGVLATAVTHAEPVGRYPIVRDDPAAPLPYTLCPGGTQVAPGARCLPNAYAAGVDWRWRSPSGSYSSGGQLAVSVLDAGPPRVVPDGTRIHAAEPGPAVTGWASKEGGYWVGDVWGTASSRTFDVNDLGYLSRANELSVGADVGYRTLDPWFVTLETESRAELYGADNTYGQNLRRGAQIDTRWKLTSFWKVYAQAHYNGAYFDDREVGDGTALERAALAGGYVEVTTDPRARIAGRLAMRADAITDGSSVSADGGITVHALPQLDVELLPQVLATRGEPRYVGTAADGAYLFGRLRATNVGATLRATYTFAPRLTLQAYGQLFLASRHYDSFATAPRPEGDGRAEVRLADLVYGAAPPTTNPDSKEGALNANVVLRWEYRLGSLVYLVYTRSQAPQVALPPGEQGSLDLGAVRRAPAQDVVLLKVSYWWG